MVLAQATALEYLEFVAMVGAALVALVAFGLGYWLGYARGHRRLWMVFLVAACGPVALGAQSSLLTTVQAVRAQYGPLIEPVDVGRVLNEVAWRHRADGWRLLLKSAGERCPSPQGVEVACDILVHVPSGRHFDALTGASDGGRPVAAGPAWTDVGPCDVPTCQIANTLEPIDPTPGAPPDPGPDSPFDPGTPGSSGVLEEILRELRRLNTHLGVGVD